MREKQILPVIVVGLTAMLVAVVALWTHCRAPGCLWKQVSIDEWSGGHVGA